MNIVLKAYTKEELMEKIYEVLSSVDEQNQNAKERGVILKLAQSYQQILRNIQKVIDGDNTVYTTNLLFVSIPQYYSYHGITLKEEKRKIS